MTTRDATGALAVLRAAQRDDLDAILAIEAVSYRHPWTRAMFEREFEQAWSSILVASETHADGSQRGHARVVGFIIFWRVQDEFHLLNVAVAEDARRRGIGTLLLNELDTRARSADAAVITLEVRAASKGAQELYRQLGYRQVGLRKNYYADEGEDAVVMLCELRNRGF